MFQLSFRLLKKSCFDNRRGLTLSLSKKILSSYIEIFPSQKSAIRTHNDFFRYKKMMASTVPKPGSENIFEESKLNEVSKASPAYENEKKSGERRPYG